MNYFLYETRIFFGKTEITINHGSQSKNKVRRVYSCKKKKQKQKMKKQKTRCKCCIRDLKKQADA